MSLLGPQHSATTEDPLSGLCDWCANTAISKADTEEAGSAKDKEQTERKTTKSHNC